eukprot:8359403-Pyramimonas_sp.AAC.1
MQIRLVLEQGVGDRALRRYPARLTSACRLRPQQSVCALQRSATWRRGIKGAGLICDACATAAPGTRGARASTFDGE